MSNSNAVHIVKTMVRLWQYTDGTSATDLLDTLCGMVDDNGLISWADRAAWEAEQTAKEGN